MVKEMAAIVAVAAHSRGIGYKGDLVRSSLWMALLMR